MRASHFIQNFTQNTFLLPFLLTPLIRREEGKEKALREGKMSALIRKLNLSGTSSSVRKERKPWENRAAANEARFLRSLPAVITS